MTEIIYPLNMNYEFQQIGNYFGHININFAALRSITEN